MHRLHKSASLSTSQRSEGEELVQFMATLEVSPVSTRGASDPDEGGHCGQNSEEQEPPPV
jgi:hypothetical protein